MTTTLPLFDVLPPASPDIGDERQSLCVELDSALLAELERRAERFSAPTSAFLCAALTLVESLLTGHQQVQSCGASEGCSRSFSIDVPRHEFRNAWLARFILAWESAPASTDFSAWAVAEENAEANKLMSTASCWAIRNEAKPQLVVSFTRPFTTSSIESIVKRVLRVCDALVTATDLPIEAIDLCDEIERRHMLGDWNDTYVARHTRETVHGIWAEQVQQYPNVIAIASGAVAISYADADARAHRVAQSLIAAGVMPGAIVALQLERSADALIAILGILKAGAAYLPLDAGFPAERLAYILNDAHASLAIAGVDISTLASIDIPRMSLTQLESKHGEASLPAMDSDALAYVMYTSGSTGTPKGVEIAHRSIIRLVRHVSYVDLSSAPRVLHAAPLGFDASTLEIWGALLNGGTCIVHDERIPSACGIAATIARHDARIAWLTAALFNTIVDDDASKLSGLRQLLIGGEALSVAHVCKAYETLPDVAIINGYGPTECTTFAATFRIPRDLDVSQHAIPIGAPIANTTVYVLNNAGELMPPGFIGELHIGGAGLARDYLGQPALTAERFVANHFGSESARFYRTGDLVHWLPNGVIQYIGRADHQVKIRGYRIELGEIEAALQRCDGVRACAVLAREDRPDQKRLVAYYVSDGTQSLARVLRDSLSRRLPDFMVPAIYIQLDALPVTTNGKLDRRALPAPDNRRPELAAPYASAVGAVEQQLCDVFAEFLGLEQVGRNDHFFDLGGSSLLAVRTLARIHADISTRPTIAGFFDAPTPMALAADITAKDLATTQAASSAHAQQHAETNAEPVAIIAMAGRFPGANDVETFWDNLCEGRESITFFTDETLDPSIPKELRNDPAYVKARGVIDGVENFDAAFFGIPPREAELMDPQQRIFLELCWECMERAGHVPDSHDGAVGIYGGMHNATYFQRQLNTRPDLIDKLGAFQVMLANEKDYLATRVAHKLNLTGPAISLNTACSTSLVAISQAFDALRAGQCDMALAGGSSVTCPPRSGYIAQSGSMLSPDGHTRSFDANAAGTVFSDGAAVVLLKRLSDAQRDGNPIYAVIRGTAVNNDGGAKASFTAPSSTGQAAVICKALNRARVDASSISYVETHGTATPLGDPIEIEGLTHAFRQSTDAIGFCAIGSLKSNVGHLVMAAGVAGVIKTALSLQQRRLPASLHYQRANDQLHLVGSPFVVNEQLRPWTSESALLRAGVSSFGVGGTNAHAILEQAPDQQPSDAASGPQLLLLSARSDAALTHAITNLGAHLIENADANLADVAWTLIKGRKRFEQRAFAVADGTSDAVGKLDAASLLDHTAIAAAPNVVFLFPGQGSQYAGMGKSLYATEPVFQAAIDDCARLLNEELGFDLRDRLFADDADALRATALTQPAIFAIEYALARLWMSLGVHPKAMIGHSVGEFVAAVIAGVMTLADGARLVARRGALMQALPSGSMLSVRMDAETLQSRLPPHLSLAAENAPNACVVAGESADVEAFRMELEHDNIACRALHTSHAFHSSMMDAALEPFSGFVSKVALSAPRIALISTMHGRPLSDPDATSTAYWTQHLRSTVMYSRALQNVLTDNDSILLEVGPRTALSSLARQQPKARGRIIVASLSDSPDSERGAWLNAAGFLWSRGLPLAVETLDHRERKNRLRLPTYPFERKRFWIDAAPPLAANAGEPSSNVVTLPLCVDNATPPVARVEPQLENSMPAKPSSTSARSQQLVEQLTGLFEDVAGNEFTLADASTHFLELGLDSLSLTQVALQLQKTFSLKITFRELMESCTTFQLLAQHIDRLLPSDTAAQTSPSIMPAPVGAPVSMSVAPTSQSLVQDVIQQQMLIMQQQLALLAGTPQQTSVISAVPVQAAVQIVAAQKTTEPSAEEEVALAHTTYDVAKAFGAIARIHSSSTELTSRQRARLDAFMRRYIDRTRKSKTYTEEHRAHLADPRVVNGFRPLLKEIIYQIVVDRSKGSRVWDIDGNEYVDALNGFGMNLFGWQPEFVIDAVRRQLDVGYEIGPQHPLAGTVAKQICELTGFDRAALCNTGSEAVMGTVRIARTVTGRDTLVIFTGSYHGIFDEVIVRGTRKLRSVPAAPGILRNTSENVLVLEYGTPESLAIIRERASTIAAVLVEPVQSRRPDFQPREFLKELRAITSDAGALLIFDEVVTGFRSHPRGAQHVLGIDADLASYGKVVGGGFPIGVIAGKRRFMDALDGGHWQFGDASTPTVGVTYFAGTFVRHPLALAAASAVLEHLQTAGHALQEALNARTSLFTDELNAFCLSVGAPIKVTHFSSVWKTNFLEDHPLQDLLFAMMRSRGIHVLDNFPCFFTTSHSEADFGAIASAFKASVLELQEADFLPRRRPVETSAFDAEKPPVIGARLGRDAAGNPAWFVPNPDAPGKFMRVSA